MSVYLLTLHNDHKNRVRLKTLKNISLELKHLTVNSYEIFIDYSFKQSNSHSVIFLYVNAIYEAR